MTGRGVGLLTLLLCGGPGPLAAQERSEPRLLMSLFGGVAGGGNLWEIQRQPFLVPGTELTPIYDTLRLTREMNPALMLGISGTVFQSPFFGLALEMTFLGLTTGDRCTMIRENAAFDVTRQNSQVCNDISGRSARPTTVTFALGGTIRPIPRAGLSPYVRFQGGFATRSSDVVEMTGSFATAGGRLERVVVNDPTRGGITPTAAITGGLMVPAGKGYQIRLELRDQMLVMRRVTGTADARQQGNAPTENFLLHSIGLAAGLDIVLEQKRGRRY